jgi:vacuolar-type H+-ATPase subunit F/Vma7
MRWVVIADELSTLGWRLAGARPLIATEHSVGQLFAAAGREADLILITADLAAHLPGAVLTAALLTDKPLLAVIPGLAQRSEPADLEQQVEHVLGIAV